MIFQKTISQVLSGAKSQTRRLVKEGETSYEASGRIMSVYHNGRLRWHVGLEYSVQPGRSKPAAGHIRLKAIRRERVNEISEGDALAEGGWKYSSCPIHKSPIASFAGLWNTIHTGAASFEAGPEVWCLEFEKVEEG